MYIPASFRLSAHYLDGHQPQAAVSERGSSKFISSSSSIIDLIRPELHITNRQQQHPHFLRRDTAAAADEAPRPALDTNAIISIVVAILLTAFVAAAAWFLYSYRVTVRYRKRSSSGAAAASAVPGAPGAGRSGKRRRSGPLMRRRRSGGAAAAAAEALAGDAPSGDAAADGTQQDQPQEKKRSRFGRRSSHHQQRGRQHHHHRRSKVPVPKDVGAPE
ncbi:hypothetical protein MN608_00189 [Microdochium nivale]|nr:hypothetical protein MN608_00189 [Microdochium nivale]